MIALIGNPFSTAYARARRRGGERARATDFVAMNVALRGPGRAGAFCLTERGHASLVRRADAIHIGASSWTMEPSGDLVVRLDERAVLSSGRVTGHVRIALGERPDGEPVHLDAAGRHRWWPLAPSARAEVRLVAPRRSFAGSAYVDAQSGDEPLEQAFRRWTWSREHHRGQAAVRFDVERRDGTRLSLSRRFAEGADRPGPTDLPPDPQRLPRTAWRLERSIRADGPARLVRSLEDGPAYARALVEATSSGARALAVHEVLDLDRLQAGWVRFLTPFRTRREARP